MTSTSELLVDGFERVSGSVHGVLKGLSLEALSFRPGRSANPIGWLVWHLTRVQDDHVADVAGTEQRWTAEAWDVRFALPFDRLETGYGQDAHEAGSVAVEPALLLGYYDSVHAATAEFLRSLHDEDLDRVVDTRWDPHVTLGVRLMSVIADDLEHVGQAAYVRGLLERQSG